MLAREHGMSRTPVREGLRDCGRSVTSIESLVTDTSLLASPYSPFTTPTMCAGCSKARRRRRPRSLPHRKTFALHADVAPACRGRCATFGAMRSTSRPPTAMPKRPTPRFHMAIAAAGRNGLAMELVERCLAQVDRFMSLGVHFGAFQEVPPSASGDRGRDRTARRCGRSRAHGRTPGLRQPTDEGCAAARRTHHDRRRVAFDGIPLAPPRSTMRAPRASPRGSTEWIRTGTRRLAPQAANRTPSGTNRQIRASRQDQCRDGVALWGSRVIADIQDPGHRYPVFRTRCTVKMDAVERFVRLT